MGLAQKIWLDNGSYSRGGEGLKQTVGQRPEYYQILIEANPV